MKKISFGLLAFTLIIGGLLTGCNKHMTTDTPPPDASSAWTHLAAPQDTITVLETFNRVIYAASAGNTLYSSSDGGATWSSLKVGPAGAVITAIRVFNGSVFVGMDYDGIFSSSDGGRTWVTHHGDFIANTVTSFAERKGILYASTQNNGVFALTPGTSSWVPFDNQLPWIITSYDVFKLVNSEDTLAAAAGINGTFYHYDFGSDQWVESLLPKWQTYITQMVDDAGDLYAFTTERKVIRSMDKGVSWRYDNEAIHPGPLNFTYWLRLLYAGTKRDYAIVDTVTGTWVQQRNRGAGVGTPWTDKNEFLKGIKTNAIVESEDRVFIGTNTGIYFRKID
jgi:photosystem II stability/assembly factor-like uncharacterized protein